FYFKDYVLRRSV
ncbi:hypothetical protein CEXT_60541, partial [Caerostris extrusa]